MSQIYLHCIRLVIDVGDASPTSDDAIDFIMKVDCSNHSATMDALRDIYENNTTPIYSGFQVYDLKAGLHIRDILSEFYARPWFSRIWVLQEVSHRTRDTILGHALLNCCNRSVRWSKFGQVRIEIDFRTAGETANQRIEVPTAAALPTVIRLVNSFLGSFP